MDGNTQSIEISIIENERNGDNNQDHSLSDEQSETSDSSTNINHDAISMTVNNL